jgi:hypothetical protein
MFPLIPVLALVALAGGGLTLVWYDNLTQAEKDKANRLANGYAQRLFGKAVSQLTAAQADRVHDLVRAHFPN